MILNEDICNWNYLYRACRVYASRSFLSSVLVAQKTSEIPGCGCLSLTRFRDGWAACHVKVGFESSVRSCVLLLQLEMIQFHGHSFRAECAESPPQFGAISSRQTCRSAALPADKKKQAARNAFAHSPICRRRPHSKAKRKSSRGKALVQLNG